MKKLITLLLLFVSSLCIAQDTTYAIETVYINTNNEWFDEDYGVTIEVYLDDNDISRNYYIIDDYAARHMIKSSTRSPIYNNSGDSYYYELFYTGTGYAMVSFFFKNNTPEMLMGIYAPEKDAFNFFCSVEYFSIEHKLKLAELMKKEIVERFKLKRY